MEFLTTNYCIFFLEIQQLHDYKRKSEVLLLIMKNW
jgi:hypothetical protein